MWQRFTEDARRVILLSHEEAKRVESNSVDTEHFLAGLLALDEGRLAPLLEKAGAKTPAVAAETMEALKPSVQGQNTEPNLTSSARLVLELAADESRRAYHTTIRPEHLLLALLRETKGRAGQILRARGASLDRARAAVMELAQSQHWTILTHDQIGDEQQLLALLERRTDLLVEILGLDVLALKKARLELLVRLHLYGQAAILRDEIENGHS